MDTSLNWKAALKSVRAILPLATVFTLLPATALAQAGLPLWTNRYTRATGQTVDQGFAVAVDASSNVYVTGDAVTIKYSSQGATLWLRTNGFGARTLALDGSGNVVVAGLNWATGNPEYAAIKFSNTGLPLWTNRYASVSGDSLDGPYLAADTNGNVFMTGSVSDVSQFKIATLKYSSVGVSLWTNSYSTPPGSGSVKVHAMAVDGSGNVVVTGTAFTNVNKAAFVAIKYSGAGVPLWTNRYNDSANVGDQAWAIAVDAGGSVVVTGESYGGSNTGTDYATVKYSSAGVPLWTNRYSGPGDGANLGDTARSVAVDAVGNVIVTGESRGTAGISDYATVKYSSAGVPLWTNRYNGPANSWDSANDLAIDAQGNVYVTGYSTGLGSDYDYATIGYSSAGVPLWTNRYNGPGNDSDKTQALAVDTSGNVYVTGYSIGSGTFYDYATIKYAGVPAVTLAILIHPLTRTNVTGTTATFSVTATGDPPLSFQWRKGGTNLLNDGRISGVTTTNLVIASVQLSDAGSYTVVVTNAYGSTTSSVAQLTVVNPGRFTNLSYSPALGFSFVFRDAILGRPYRIQRSPSMAAGSWSNWQSFTYTEPLFLLDMGATAQERRFYRAVSP